MTDAKPTQRPGFPIWETVAIFLAIASLWPAYILDWPDPIWRILCYLMLAAMAAVFVRRILTFRRLAREADERRRTGGGKQGRARLPWEPPGS